MYNFVSRQKLKYFGHVTRHNGLEKTIMQGMVAGKRSRGKPRQKWEKDHRYVWCDGCSKQRTGINFAETSGQRRPDEDMLREEKEEEELFHVFENVLP